MTNRQNDENDVLLTPVNNDHHHHNDHTLSADDLQLTPQKPHEKRDYIETVPQSADAVLFVPASTSHHSSRKQKPKRPLHKKILLVLLILLLVFVGIGLIALCTYAVMYHIGKKQLLPSENVAISAPAEILKNPQVTIENDGRTVKYNGKTYTFNQNRTNILCIGKDKNKTGEYAAVGERGQADTIVLVSIDTKTGQIDAIPIPRDTITAVKLFREDGSYHGVENTQICLSYAYGADDALSCENVADSVSRLFYGIPINTYYCMDLEALPILNDAIGGVTVKSTGDFVTFGDKPVPNGTVLHLMGKDAERYVRYRDVTRLDSNSVRMQRQQQYLTAFFETAMTATKSDLQVPVRLFNAASEHSTTTLNASRITVLSTTLVSKNANLRFHPIDGGKGTVVQGDDGYAEYHVDEEALYETILNVFYTCNG